MLQRALDAGVPAGWVTADEVYGGSPALRGWLESRQLPYVLAVRCTEPLRSPSGTPASAARPADPEGFAGMGCVEALVHGHDIAQGLGLALAPPREVCTRVLARMFPRVPQFVATWRWPEGAFRWSGTQGVRLEALRTWNCSNTTGREELDLPVVLWFVCGHVSAVHAARQHRRHRRALRRAGPQPAGGRQGQAGCADEPGPGRPAGHRRASPAGRLDQQALRRRRRHQ